MLDHMILTVSNVERSLAFYEAALKCSFRNYLA
jgi:catechol 2,3-dioxygenase-like lactoylglutathione lyase family enzyme